MVKYIGVLACYFKPSRDTEATHDKGHSPVDKRVHLKIHISRYTISRSNEKFPVLSAHDPCVTCYGGPLTESFVLYIHVLSH